MSDFKKTMNNTQCISRKQQTHGVKKMLKSIIRPRQVNTRLDYCKELENMLESQRAVGRTGKVFQGLGAASSRNNLATMRSLMLEYKPVNTLEIGMAFGASTLALAACHKELGRSANKQHVAIDPFQTTVWDDTGRIALENADLLPYVDIVEDYSYNALPNLLKTDHRFDLVYIDGSHLFEDVFIDFFYSSRLLSKDGLLIFDESSDPHIRKVLRFIDKNLVVVTY